MSPRTVKRRRRSKGQLTAAGTSVSPATLLAQFTELVSENQALARENRELHVVIARVTKAVDVLSSSPRAGRRSLQQPAGRGGAQGNGRRRQRRRITDPASLERRRAALAKARQVLAEKRAAEKATP
jgi:hypothetical protein